MQGNEQYFLKLDSSQIKALELPELKKAWPVYEAKQKQVSRQLESSEQERSRQKQKMVQVQMQKSELEKHLLQKKQIYQELEERGKKANQQLEKIRVMCPLYEFQMHNFFEEIYPTQRPKSEEAPVALNYSIIEENLIKQKNELEAQVSENQELLNNFLGKFNID